MKRGKSSRKQDAVSIVEVGARDGLQNESIALSVGQRVTLLKRLVDSGIKRLEVGAFVRSDRVPQMAGSAEVVSAFRSAFPNHQGSVLVPNLAGFEFALNSGVQEVAVFTAASETFCKKNINCSIAESLERFRPVLVTAKAAGLRVRGYVSTVVECPFEGDVDPKKVARLTKRLLQMGCYEVSLGDTIGAAVPKQVIRLLKACKDADISAKKLAGHFHDTHRTALANIVAAYNSGVRVFDSSIGGLGGCPFAPGAAGNVATEDVVYLFDKMGVPTGVDRKRLLSILPWLESTFSRPFGKP